MPILGRNCGITVNGTGLMASSVSLSQSSTLNHLIPIGFNNSSIYTVNGNLENEIKIDYLINNEQEPIYWNFSGIKTNYSGVPLNINIGGLTGQFYLTSYSFNSSPNQPVTASVNLINFSNITGNFTGLLIRNITGNLNQEITNGASVIIRGSDNNLLPIDDLSYSCNIEYIPLYKIGQKTPYSIIFNRAIENISISSDDYTGIGFYGFDSVSNILKGANNIQLSNFSTISGTNVLNFPISGARTSSLNQDFTTQGIIKNKYSIINLY